MRTQNINDDRVRCPDVSSFTIIALTSCMFFIFPQSSNGSSFPLLKGRLWSPKPLREQKKEANGTSFYLEFWCRKSARLSEEQKVLERYQEIPLRRYRFESCSPFGVGSITAVRRNSWMRSKIWHCYSLLKSKKVWVRFPPHPQNYVLVLHRQRFPDSPLRRVGTFVRKL